MARHYGGIQDDDRNKLHELVKDYPYSQIIHTLLAKANSDANTDIAQQVLSYAALYTTDRSVLKEIIQSKGTEYKEAATVEAEESSSKVVEQVHEEQTLVEESTTEISKTTVEEKDESATIESEKESPVVKERGPRRMRPA